MKSILKFMFVFFTSYTFVFAAVNINTASKEELMSISGIGEAKAQAIINYRQNTPFKSKEDIKNVKGISDKSYEKIKDSIKVSQEKSPILKQDTQDIKKTEKPKR